MKIRDGVAPAGLWLRSAGVVLLGFLAALLLLAGPGAGAARAHSELVGVDVEQRPANGQAAANLVLTLAFSEAIDPGFGRVDVVGADGTSLDVRSVQVTDDLRHMKAEVGAVPEGTYTVGWFVRSRDGDASNGSTEISVRGDAAVASVLPPVNARDPAWQPPMTWRMTTVSALVRWLNYIGATLFTGAVLFRLFVWPVAFARDPDGRRPGGSEETEASMPGFVGLLVAGLGTLFFANVLLLLLQASFVQLATLQPVDSASPVPVDPSGLQQARASTAVGEILATYAGVVWIVRMALIAVLAGLTWRLATVRRHTRMLLGAALLTALGVLLTLSLTAHAAFVPETFRAAAIAVLIDWSHLVAVSLWIGGLPPLLLALRASAASPGRPNPAEALLQRFSPLALGSVAFLALTGVGSSYFEVGDPALLFKTVYGVTLGVKLALIGVLVGIGALNRYVLIPRVTQGGAGIGFHRSLPVEIGFGMLLLFTVAMLASQGAAATAWPAHEALGDGIDQTVSDTSFLLRIVPGAAGQNTIAVDVTDRRRGAWRTEGSAQVTASGLSPSAGWPTTRFSFENTPTERYLINGPVRLQQGTTRFSVRLERPGYEPITATFDARIAAPDGGR